MFVDTNYFVAIFNAADQWHSQAIDADKQLGNVWLITTDFVLIEVLNYFSGYNKHFKKRISQSVRRLLDDLEIQKIECSHKHFLDGFVLYEARLDKGYSLTDCFSMNVMRENSIDEILTNDTHFDQEGFRLLL